MSRRTNKTSRDRSKGQETIKKRQDKQKYAFVQHLKKQPIIEVAARRTGVDRTTIYRWMAEDTQFKDIVGYAMKEGVSVTNDMMESLLIKAAQDGKVGPIQFWLRNRHPAYLSIRLQEKFIESIGRSLNDDDLSAEEIDEVNKILEQWGFSRDKDGNPKRKKKK